MKSMSHLKITIFIAGILTLLTACQKNEFMPEPVGEEIPAPNYPALLDGLPDETSLFKTMWQKAGMDAVLATEQAQARLTFLVPSNAAMEAAGYSTGKIQQLTEDSLQHILRYHVLNGAISSEQLRHVGGNLTFFTLLKHAKFLDGEPREGSLVRTVPYCYRQQLTVEDGNLIANGSKFKIDKEVTVSQGNVLIIEKVLEAPRQQMYDFLVKDGRFSLYLKALEISNIDYATEMAMNWYASFALPVRFMIDWNYYFEGTFHYSADKPRHVIHCTLFAPTDEAFHEIAIYTEADLRALNGRIETPLYYEQNQRTPVDSLLRYQYIGTASSEATFNEDYSALTLGVQLNRSSDNTSLFSDMLDNKKITGLSDGFNYIGHRFDRSGKHIKVSHLHSKEKQVTITEENINTIQGPIHVVDRILVPDEFSMWHKK